MSGLSTSWEPTPLYNNKFETQQYSWAVVSAVIAAFASACKLVLLRASAIRAELPPLAMLFWVDTITFVFLVPISFLMGEMSTFVDALSNQTPSFNLLVAFTAALGGLRFGTELFALQFMDAMDLSAINTFASLGYVLLSLPIFHLVSPTKGRELWIAGITIAFVGLIGYFLAVRQFTLTKGRQGAVFFKCGRGLYDKAGTTLWTMCACLPPCPAWLTLSDSDADDCCDDLAIEKERLEEAAGIPPKQERSCCFAWWLSRKPLPEAAEEKDAPLLRAKQN